MFKLKSLRAKVIASTFLFVLFFFILQVFVSQNFFIKGYLDLEKSESLEALERANVVFNKQSKNMDIKVADWAIWDDSYKFVQDRNTEFIESNLKDLALQTLDINGIYYIASSSALVYGETYDYDKEQSVPAPSDLQSILSSKNSITSFKSDNGNKDGIIKLSSGLLFFASRPILKSDGTGPSKGAIVFVRYLDDSLQEYLEEASSTKIRVFDYDSNSLPPFAQKAKANLAANKTFEAPLSDEDVASYSIIKDYNGKPAYILEAVAKRDIYNQGKNSVIGFLVIVFIISVVFMVFAAIIINFFVVSKISKLNKDVGAVSDFNESKFRLEVKGNDEFSNLATNINKMLDEVKKSEEDLVKFKVAIENSSEQVLITDIEGKIIYANKSSEQLTGYSVSEMIGNTPRLWGGQMPEQFYENMWDIIKNRKQPFVGRLINKRKNGERYPVENKIYPIVDGSDKIIYFVTVERDISQEIQVEKSLADIEKKNISLQDSQKALANILEDEKELEDALKREKEGVEKKVIERTTDLIHTQTELKASISSLTLGFIMTDSKNNILLINQSAKNLLCASATSPLATVKDCTLVHIEDELKGAIDLRALINQTVATRKPTLIKELAFGSKFLKIYITPITELADVIGTVVLIDDITETKIIERSKDEFFSIASHELRTPLTAIRGNTSLIEQYYLNEIKDKDLKEMIDDIHHSSIRLIDIVNDFLDMSRLELGKIVFKKEPINLAEIVQSVIKEYETTGSLKMLYLKFDAPKEPIPLAIGDKERVRQILVNLIGNAVKYTEKGGVTLTIDKKEGFLEALVSDTGRGISQENQALLFRKFQQASDNIYTRDSSQSTGLGLYISRLMAQGMGGSVGIVKSVVGVGSTFSVSLPIYESKEASSG